MGHARWKRWSLAFAFIRRIASKSVWLSVERSLCSMTPTVPMTSVERDRRAEPLALAVLQQVEPSELLGRSSRSGGRGGNAYLGRSCRQRYGAMDNPVHRNQRLPKIKAPRTHCA